jgi:hypothetical protein
MSGNTYHNPAREHDPNVCRLIYLMLKAQEKGTLDVGACIRAVREGKADHIGVIGG